MIRAESAVFVSRGAHGAGFTPLNPTVQSFQDVSLGSWVAKWADTLLDDGFTSGCATEPLRFCPNAPHSRTEGAVFYMRMLNGPFYYPPNPSGIFVDAPTTYWGARWIEAAYNAGLVFPCSNVGSSKYFCPEDPLTRAMAAYMMVQAKGLGD
jgi:hypothetical protein